MATTYEYFDVTGGGSTLSGYAFPEVHKFDASAFYNWEQDNLPVLDLENRSNVLKQHLGLISLSAATLTVSANAPKSASSTGVYQTVQDALKVVPRRLNFPLLIEICSFGDLGDLELADINCEGNGALQIVCRQYASSVTSKTGMTASSYTYGPQENQTLPLTFSGASTLGTAIEDASSTKLGVSCSSVDAWDRHARVYFAKLPDSQDETQLLGFAPFPRRNAIDPRLGDINFSSAADTFSVTPYSYLDDKTVYEDVNPKTANGTGNSLLALRTTLAGNDDLSIAAYGAYFRNIRITNCSRVKLKNICVDSASGSDYEYPRTLAHYCPRGIDLLNSNVLLENVAISRTSEYGIYADNSVISSKGGLIVYRVYGRTTSERRTSKGVGVFLIDSTLAFNTSAYAGAGTDLVNISKCEYGLQGINSLVTDGAVSTLTNKNAGGADTRTSRIFLNGNNIGCRLENSVYNYNGRTESFCNLKGFDAYNSILEFPQFSVEDNQGPGFYLSKSTLQYGKDCNSVVAGTSYSGTVKPSYACDYNGINVYADKGSTVSYPNDCSSVSGLGFWGGSFSGTGHAASQPMASHGSVHGARQPAILVSENSNAELAHLSVAVPKTMKGVAGACVRAERNSSITFRGTGKSATCLGGYGSLTPEQLKDNWTNAAVAATEDSNIAFTGPTKIGGLGVGVLAQTNSRMSFGPPTSDYTSWVPDSSKFSLSATANHSRLDVHSSRACLVANDKSTIDMAAMGGSSLTPSASVDSNENFNLSALYASATSGSYVSLYPNGFTEQVDVEKAGGNYFDIFGRTLNAVAEGNEPAITTGGMVVRAVGASKVNVNKVNFKVGAVLAPQLSGVCYNYHGTGCEFDGTQTSGIGNSITSNICDLVTDCCDSVTTVTTVITATSITTNTSITTITETTPTGPTTTSVTSTTSTTSTTSVTTSTTLTTSTTVTTSTTATTSSTPTGTSTSTTTSTSVTSVTSVTSTTSVTTSTTSTTTTIQTIQTINQPSVTFKGWDTRYLVDENQLGTGDTIQSEYNTNGSIEFSCIGTQIHLWNIADTSRIHASNLLINGVNPTTTCINNAFHGPTGRWFNGAACDYYGRFGFAASAMNLSAIPNSVNGFYNLGVFRIVGSHKGYLKTYSEVDYDGYSVFSQMLGGGSPMDQVNSQGYQTMFDAAINTLGAEDTLAYHVGLEPGGTPNTEPVFGRGLAGKPYHPGKINGVVTHARMTEGMGMLWDAGQLHPSYPIPPLHLGWQGYLRNWVDESAANVFANARHGASKKVNLLSIYRSSTDATVGGEGRDQATGNPTFGLGVRSLNMFDLNRLV